MIGCLVDELIAQYHYDVPIVPESIHEYVVDQCINRPIDRLVGWLMK